MLSTWVVIFPFQGTQFDFKEDWGEQLISKCCPVLVIYDMTTDEIKVLEGVPEHISAGQVGWNTTSVLSIYRRFLPNSYLNEMYYSSESSQLNNQTKFDAKFNSDLKCVQHIYEPVSKF